MGYKNNSYMQSIKYTKELQGIYLWFN